MKAISSGQGWARHASNARVVRVTLTTIALAVTLGTGCRTEGQAGRVKVDSVAAALPAAGRAAIYTLELDSEVDYGEGAGLALSLRSAAEVQRLPDIAPGVVALDLTLPEARFSARGDNPREFDVLAAELARGVVLEMQAGRLRAVRSEGALSAFAASILRSVASALELPLPSEPTATRWTAETTDSAGECTLEINALGSQRYAKKKLRCQAASLAPAAGIRLDLQLVPTVLASQGTLEAGADGVSSSSYDERLEMALAGGAKARAHNRVVLRQVGTKKTSPRQRAATTLLAPPEPKATRVDHAALDAAKVGAFSFDSALGALAASAASAETLLATDRERRDEAPEQSAARERRLNEHSRAFSAMTAILRTQPDTVPRAVALVRAAKPAAKLLIDALAAADTAVSTAALVGLVGDARLGAELREAVVHDLTRVETPSAETVAALTQLLDTADYGLIAWYGLGTQARHLRDSGAHAEAERLGNLLGARLAQAQDTDGRVHALRAIANSGLSTLLPVARPLLTDRSEVVRSAAIEALRLMDSPEADRLIASRLAEEESAFVRRAVLNAAKTRQPNAELRAAVLGAADHEPDDHGRYAAISLLVRWLPRDPTLREPLLRIAENDRLPALRSAARAAL